MTGRELLNYALSHMGEVGNGGIETYPYSIMSINVILSETFDTNNEIMRSNGLEPLTVAPEIVKIDDEIPYDKNLIKACLSYGLASKLILEDNDLNKFNFFNGMYIQAMQNNTKATEEFIENLY